MEPKDILFQLTREIAEHGTKEQKVAVWEWVTKAVPHPLVPRKFMNAWNACDVVAWIEHRENFSTYFR